MKAERFGGLRLPLAAWVLLAACAAPAVVQAASTHLVVSEPWMRAIGGATPAAAYFTLSNTSDKPHVLKGFSSPECGALMMHESRTVNGVSSMVMVDQRVVPPHGRIVFSPGGYHLMCTSPSKAVRPGQRIPITFRFADGRSLVVPFPVRPLS